MSVLIDLRGRVNCSQLDSMPAMSFKVDLIAMRFNQSCGEVRCAIQFKDVRNRTVLVSQGASQFYSDGDIRNN